MAKKIWHSQPVDLQIVDHKMVPSAYHNRLYVGVSGSGKTTECLRFILHFNDYYPNVCVRSVFIIAPIYHVEYEKIVTQYGKDIVSYFPNFEHAMTELVCDVGTENTVSIVLIDDMACQLTHSKELEKLFTTMTRHNKLNVSLTSQSIFQSSYENWRTVIKNAHVIILSNSPRERRSTQILFSQLFGHRGSTMADCVLQESLNENICRYGNPFFFIYLNLSPDCNPALRIVYDNLSNDPIVFKDGSINMK